MTHSRATAIGHAGELLQGALPISGHPEPFLVTLPAPTFRSVCCARLAPAWIVDPVWKLKALRAAQLATEEWGFTGAMHLRLRSSIPVARGCGSSTADCVAAVRAVARTLNVNLSPASIGRLVQRAEGAADSTMFPQPVAFLQRRGQVLRTLHGNWPAMYVTVLDLGGPAVDTLACETPSYTRGQCLEFEALLDQLACALRRGDAAAVGRIALRSAEIHQMHRPHPQWPSMLELAARHHAYGVARAHSGTVAAILSPQPLPLASVARFALTPATQPSPTTPG